MIRQRRPQRVERRRQLVEINLISERHRPLRGVRRGGCAQAFALLALSLGAVLAAWAGLH